MASEARHKPLRILHLYKSASPDSVGGIEKVIDEVARGCSAHGLQTDVLALSADSGVRTADMGGYLLHRAHRDLQFASTGLSLSGAWRFAQLARQADVIHYHFPWPFMDLVHFATAVSQPTVLTYHADIVKQQTMLRFYRPLKHAFLRSVDRIFATSPNYRESSTVLQAHRDKVGVIPIGIDKQGYPQAESARVQYWKGRFKNGFFLFVGVLRYYKGLHVLLEAAAKQDFPVVVAGAGPMEAELKNQA
ncbi:MAG TPA: glycosyltransferase, partial [Ramlibacter sp.]|nr:glycosyltransferase [Ramlibacter sp.]